MKTYLISYDLADSDSNEYAKLFEYIKGYRTWAHITESLWAVKTHKTALSIRAEIKEIVDNSSSIFIVKSGIEAAWSNVICRNIWLKDNL
jgi:hypothetical protein